MSHEVVASLNGELISEPEATDLYEFYSEAFDDTAYTTARTYHGKLYRIESHAERVLDSAKTAKIKHKLTKKKIIDITQKTFEKSGFKNAVIKIFLSKEKEGALFVFLKKLESLPEHIYTKGVKVLTVNAERKHPRAKILQDYSGKSIVGTRKKGYFEAILINRNGFATECTASNLFLVKNKIIYTPKNNILLGITRDELIHKMPKHYKFVEKEIHERELFSADEIFVTGTVKEIVPVVKVDEHVIGRGIPGEISLKLIKDFHLQIKKENF